MLPVRKTWLALVAVLVLTAAGNADPAPEPKVVSDDDSKWLVNDAEVIAKVNIKQLMASELMKKVGTDLIKDAIKTNEQAKTIIEATGIDVTRDLDHILISGAGKSAKDVKALVVVRGRFDTTKLHDALKKQADKGDRVKLVKEGATQLYEITEQDQSMFAALVDRNTIVVTQSKAATLDAVKNGGRETVLVSKEMKKALSKFTSKESLSLALVVNEELRKMLNNAPRVGDAAGKLQTLTLGLTITDAVALNLNGVTGDPKAAKQLAAGLELLKAAGGAAVAGMDEVAFLGDILNELKVVSGKDAVDVNLKITKMLIDKAMKGDK